MRCNQIKDLLSPYMDGMTNEKENRLVKEHLAECPSCREELERMQFIALCLNKMEVPPCPEGLVLDVRKRIVEEKNKVFSLREAAKPKRQGWMAAGIAGIALLIGIYINSILPVENIAFLWRDKDSEAGKNVAIVGKGPLDRIMGITGIGKEEKRVAQAPFTEDEDNDGGNVAVTDKETVKPAVPGKKSAGGIYVAEQLAAQIKVGDIDKSTQEVIKLAQASGAEYKIVDSMQPLSGEATKTIELAVEKDKADSIIQQLSLLGEVSDTSRNQVSLTEQYNKVQEEINILNEKIAQAEKEGNAEAKADLEKKLQELNGVKNDIEGKMAKITLKVYLVENVKP
ncbi:Putative zinc-finger [Thermosyntropha lipolytica DSM 11003]|uniref:Anti-sigma-W factor RsiW n=1 Tax=Thermosyntropha lipolytica DSM 11003 TaxID=1123382 RepID=A0A1M5MZV1_9FIRM|nr:zf-HC2 domain-containing protein [Thermosyntropha lipolytica]SHG82844.1 Putative zinc-finger [Thermosyntropha lipolytica DSM 11003]